MGWEGVRRYGGLILLAGTSVVGAVGSKCAITGRVADPQGGPLEYATVTAVRTGALGFGQEAPAGGATTDARGEFCLTGLRPGEYFIRVLPRRPGSSASPGCRECCAASSEFVPGFYCGKQRDGRRRSVRVEEGRTVSGVVVAMRRAPAYCVPGEVRDGTGALRGDVALSLEAAGWSASVINERGRFLLTSLVAGEYQLVIRAGGPWNRVLARELIRVSGKGGRVVVRLH